MTTGNGNRVCYRRQWALTCALALSVLVVGCQQVAAHLAITDGGISTIDVNTRSCLVTIHYVDDTVETKHAIGCVEQTVVTLNEVTSSSRRR